MGKNIEGNKGVSVSPFPKEETNRKQNGHGQQASILKRCNASYRPAGKIEKERGHRSTEECHTQPVKAVYIAGPGPISRAGNEPPHGKGRQQSEQEWQAKDGAPAQRFNQQTCT